MSFAGIGRHMKLLHIAADAVDLRDPGHGADLRPDHPILQGPEIRGRKRGAVGLPGPRLRLHGPHEDLAETRGDGPHLRLDTRGQSALGLLNTLVDEAPREIDIGAVLKDHGDLGQPIAGERAGFLQARQARDYGFDGEGDALLDLQGGIARHLGVDLDLDVGDVRDGVDGQALVVVNPQHGHGEGGKKNQPALFDGKFQEAFKHVHSSNDRGSPRTCPTRP